MASYRFLAYDLRTNVLIDELPLAIKRFGDVLNGVGEFEATLSMPENSVQVRSLLAATIPERTVVYVERDGVLLNAYVIWSRVRQSDQPMRLNGLTLPSLLRRNRLNATITATGVDQFTIANTLVNYIQSQQGGNFGITTLATVSGVLRDRVYNGYERKNAYDALAELGAVENGFDWAIDIAWSAGVPTKTLRLSYPRRGRIAGSTGIVFESGKNITDYTFTEDGLRSARSIDAFGSGDGNDMKITTATDTALLDAGYPLTSDYVSHKDVTVTATLDGYARDAVRARSMTPTFLAITVDPSDVEASLGSFIVGDDAYVSITDRQLPRQDDGSPGHAGYYRILGYDVLIPEAGPERVSVTLGTIL